MKWQYENFKIKWNWYRCDRNMTCAFWFQQRRHKYSLSICCDATSHQWSSSIFKALKIDKWTDSSASKLLGFLRGIKLSTSHISCSWNQKFNQCKDVALSFSINIHYCAMMSIHKILQEGIILLNDIRFKSTCTCTCTWLKVLVLVPRYIDKNLYLDLYLYLE